MFLNPFATLRKATFFTFEGITVFLVKDGNFIFDLHNVAISKKAFIAMTLIRSYTQEGFPLEKK
jgi:hypothetical protein